MTLRSAPRLRSRRLIVDILEDRSLLSAGPAFLQADSIIPEANDIRETSFEAADQATRAGDSSRDAGDDGDRNSNGMGPQVREWLREGSRGRALADQLHQAQQERREARADDRDDEDDRPPTTVGRDDDDARPVFNNPMKNGQPVSTPARPAGEGRDDTPRAGDDEDGPKSPAAKPTTPTATRANGGKQTAVTTPTADRTPDRPAKSVGAREETPRPESVNLNNDVAEDRQTAVVTDGRVDGEAAEVTPAAVVLANSPRATAGYLIADDPADAVILAARPVAEEQGLVPNVDGNVPAVQAGWADAAPLAADADAAFAGALYEGAAVGFLPLLRGDALDLSAESPGNGAVQELLAQLGALADLDAVKASVPWLTAAGMTVLACELARRHLKPADERGLYGDPADPAFGWLPDDDLPRGGV